MAATDPTYSETYFQDTYGNTSLGRFSRHWWSVRLYAGIAARLLRRMGGRRVLDVGCGFGFILSMLEDRFDTFGIDISSHAVRQCRRIAPKSHCAVADITREVSSDLASSSFDCVISCYVFEHLADPPAAMVRVVELLRPGGVLFFSVPNTESIGARWKGERWYAHQDPTHCSLLPPERWLDMTRAAGLTVERETSDGYWDLPYLRWLPKWMQWPLFIGPSAVACLTASAILPARFGENIMVIARKPDQREQSA